MIRQSIKRKHQASASSNNNGNTADEINYARTLIINDAINDPDFPLLKQYTREVNADYSNLLTLYTMPPVHHSELTLQEFETFGLDRLKFLMELHHLQSNLNLKLKEILEMNHYSQLLNKYMKSCGNDLKQMILKDYYGHYILRLVFLKDDENMDLLCSMELLLLKLKFQSIKNKEDKLKFLKQNSEIMDINQDIDENNLMITMSDIEDENLLSKFHKFYNNNGLNTTVHEDTPILKLKFNKIIDILPSRNVLLYKGYVYLPEHMQFNYLSQMYSKNLKLELVKILKYKMVHLTTSESDRLIPIINHLNNNGSVLNNYSSKEFENTDSLNYNQIYNPEVYNNFPLCMQNLLTNLKNQSHLKYTGRQQLSIFLKECGLNIEEALKFWQFSFQKKYSMDDFNKNYKYNLRHNYGLEGSRINFKPWDCNQILNKDPPSNDMYHGCPFRDWNKNKLVDYLSKSKNVYTNDNLTKFDINTIVDLKNQKDYMMACTRYFEFTKDVLPHNEMITHPNLYYQRSKTIQANKGGKE